MCRAIELESYARDCHVIVIWRMRFQIRLEATEFNIKTSITSGGRLFQISGAVQLKVQLANAVRTLPGTASRRLADDCRTRVGSSHFRSDGRYSGLTVCNASQVNNVTLNVILNRTESQCSLFSTGVILSNLRVRVTTAVEFCRCCSLTVFDFFVP